MATVKVVLRKKANKEGHYPLAIRVTKDRKTTYIYLGQFIKAEHWVEGEQRVKSSHPNSKRLNNLILTRKAEANDKALEAETQKESISLESIRQKIKPQGGLTFFSQAEMYLQRLQDTGNYNCYNAEKARVKFFREFLDKKDIAFSDITVGLLERFKTHLKSVRKLSDRTIANYMMLIRTIFSQAIKENGLDTKYYPFGKDRVSIKKPESTKIGLTAEDVAKLESVILSTVKQDDARNKWLISFYFAGMRISDVMRLKWSDFKNGRLYYAMGKNKKVGSLLVPDEVWPILEKYRSQKSSIDDYVFPTLKGIDPKDEYAVKYKIALDVNSCNKILLERVGPAAQIQGRLTTHIARHTFATLAADKVPLQMLQKLYRHSDVRTTIGYQSNFIIKDADDALATVLQTVKG